MNLTNQKKFYQYTTELISKLTDNNMDVGKFTELQTEIASQELLVPIIGAFSAGKSSMLNDFLKQEILPVGIAPETELATELRFGIDEHILATLVDGGTERFNLEQFDDIKNRSKEFSHIKVFLNNEQLKRVQPLVLVDMPGFGSSLANHNKAINYYLPRGVHFVVVVSVEEGNITRSMTRQLNELENLERDFAIVLSKTNLRSPEQVNDLRTYIQEQVEDSFEKNHPIACIGNVDSNELSNLIDTLNPEQIFQTLFLQRIKNATNSLLDDISIQKNSLKNDSSLNQNTINELSQAINNIESKRDGLIRDLQTNYSDRVVNRCIESIGKELNHNSEELSNHLIRNNQEGFNRAVVEIVREGFSYTLKSEFQDISHDVIQRFNSELSSLNNTMSDFGMTNEWTKDIAHRVQQSIEATGSIIGKLSKHLSSKSDAGKVFKTLSTIVAVTTGVVAPVVELVIIFLPEIIGFFSKKSQENKIKEAVQNEIIPKIKNELGKHIPQLVKEQLSLMIDDIANSFETELEEKRQLIAKYEEERNEKIEVIQEEISKLDTLSQNVTSLAEESLY